MSHEDAANALRGATQDDNDNEMMLDADEAAEEIPEDEDAPMDSDGEDEDGTQQQEISLQNDSTAHFDAHAGNSIFCIAQHPTHPNIIATGGGDDDEGKDSGFGFVFDVSAAPSHTSGAGTERAGIPPLQKLETHTDSITAVAFTLPSGAFLVTAGLDGRLVAYQHQPSAKAPYKHLATAQEVEEINFLAACPNPDHPNTIALGASDGSVWVYSIDPADTSSALSIVQTFYIHTGSCTASAWTPDGKLLATVSEDGSLYVWDVFGDAAAAGLGGSGQQYVVGLTAEDERFKVEGGLYSIAVSPNGALAAVGGAEGQIRVVGLPRLSGVSDQAGKTGAGAKAKAGGSKQSGDKAGAGAGQAGTILASLTTGADSVETLAFAPSPLTLLAAGTVDGSISVFDTSKNFLLRRRVGAQSAGEEEEGHAIVKVEFVDGKGGDASWLLTSCGLDGVLRRWDLRASGAGQGLLGEWKGHRGGGDGGGIMGFVQGDEGGNVVVTAGDEYASQFPHLPNPSTASLEMLTYYAAALPSSSTCRIRLDTVDPPIKPVKTTHQSLLSLVSILIFSLNVVKACFLPQDSPVVRLASENVDCTRVNALCCRALSQSPSGREVGGQ